MRINWLLRLCLATFASCSVHQVYEDQVEHRNENIRVARNPRITYEIVHQPPTFNFEAAKQQDYLKHRYAQQQIVDAARIVNRNNKNKQYFNQPAGTTFTHRFPQFQRSKKDTEEWKPLLPEIIKQDIERLQNVNFRITTNNTNAKLDSNKQVMDSTLKMKNFSNPLYTNNGNLEAAKSVIVEEKHQINRKDSPVAQTSVFYVNPNTFKQNFGKSLKEMLQALDAPKKSETQLKVLNELINKNPNVQLEGLQRLLGETPVKNHISAALKTPQPFPAKDHTLISEKTVDISNPLNRLNVQINAENAATALQIPHIPGVINKDSLGGLQKQLDEAAKLQVEQVLARAHQEAQAHVEAQHRAIALAQAEAQRVALENFEKTLYANPTALPLVQQTIQSQTRALPVKSQPVASSQAVASSSDISAVTVNQNVPVTPYPVHAEIQYAAEQQQQHLPPTSQDILANEHSPQVPVHKQLAAVPSVNTLPISSYEEAPSRLHSAKEILSYAPDHLHQDVAQLEAEKASLAQIETENVHEPRESVVVSPHQTVQLEEQRINIDNNAGISSFAQPEPTPSTYRHLILDTKHTENANKLYPDAEQKAVDEDELQYAAKYAFGYRIKDAKEGNDFGHEERRNGKSAEGSYHVLLPDGRLQKVQYYVDNGGYHAKVTYEHIAN